MRRISQIHLTRESDKHSLEVWLPCELYNEVAPKSPPPSKQRQSFQALFARWKVRKRAPGKGKYRTILVVINIYTNALLLLAGSNLRQTTSQTFRFQPFKKTLPGSKILGKRPDGKRTTNGNSPGHAHSFTSTRRMVLLCHSR